MPGRTRLRAAKNKLRSLHRKAERLHVRIFRSYGRERLEAAIRDAGIETGDAVMLHSAFEPRHGFLGTSGEVVDAFLDVLGPQGHLLMVSLPYRSSTLEYLQKLKRFDVNRTPSAMGLMSEFFRRRAGVVRSLHPTHPVLVHGPLADWFVEGHERCVYPCGPDTPFARLLEAGGKVAFFNVPFAYLTFFHFLEHSVHERLPFSLYTDAPFEVPVVDRAGVERTVRTYAFSAEVIRRRRFEVFESWVRARRLIREVRVGASHLMVAEVRKIANAVEEKAQQGEYFYDLRPEI